MALSTDFLRQARELATRHGRPSQINLRRSTSAAYYAVFHLLIEEVVERMVPSQPVLLRARASRAMQHGEMKQVCNALRSSSPPKNLQAILPSPLSPELQAIAKAFVGLQEKRHAADYDSSTSFSQTAVPKTVLQAEAVFRMWRKIRTTDEANVFLAALALGARWNR
jgi:hypothetical protein